MTPSPRKARGTVSGATGATVVAPVSSHAVMRPLPMSLDTDYRAMVRSRGITKRDILDVCDRLGVRFLRLQFTDILGVVKNVEVPRSQFDKALDAQIMFDGSSIEGFVRIEESDMLLAPDLDTFRIFPWGAEEGLVARLICDIRNTDDSDFAGCPRLGAQAAGRARPEAGVHDDGGRRGRVLPVLQGRARGPDDRSARRRRATSTSARWIAASTRGG